MERLNGPSYRALGVAAWARKKEFFSARFSPCRLCPRQCGAERLDDRPGACHAARQAQVAAHNLHFGEEPPISGERGSGTIFFSGCTLKCLFCQNFPISQLAHGEALSVEQLAGMFLSLQKRGAHNINLVSPTPYLHHVVDALEIASARGLNIPFVYNTSGYECAEVVAQLEGIVDIYLPDLKYGPADHSRRLGFALSGVRDYFDQALPALQEMFRQAGPLQLDGKGIAVRGMVVRHLIIPGHTANSIAALRAMAASPFREAWLSLMSQYFPAHLAPGRTPFDRRLHADEWREVRDEALRLGLEEGWFQEIE
ncbi:MAG: radical SAM protein [Acidobacteria bacterium]|nr:radical SAM protein [Acidobacteriota bacterium]